LREWLGTRTAAFIVFIVAVVLLAVSCQTMIARDSGDKGKSPVASEKTGTLYEQARREEAPEYTISFADRRGPEHYSIGVITEPTNDKARLGAIAVTEARDRSVDHVTRYSSPSQRRLCSAVTCSAALT
jgi:hypothetical protein